MNRCPSNITQIILFAEFLLVAIIFALIYKNRVGHFFNQAFYTKELRNKRKDYSQHD